VSDLEMDEGNSLRRFSLLRWERAIDGDWELGLRVRKPGGVGLVGGDGEIGGDGGREGDGEMERGRGDMGREERDFGIEMGRWEGNRKGSMISKTESKAQGRGKRGAQLL